MHYIIWLEIYKNHGLRPAALPLRHWGRRIHHTVFGTPAHSLELGHHSSEDTAILIRWHVILLSVVRPWGRPVPAHPGNGGGGYAIVRRYGDIWRIFWSRGNRVPMRMDSGGGGNALVLWCPVFRTWGHPVPTRPVCVLWRWGSFVPVYLEAAPPSSMDAGFFDPYSNLEANSSPRVRAASSSGKEAPSPCVQVVVCKHGLLSPVLPVPVDTSFWRWRVTWWRPGRSMMVVRHGKACSLSPYPGPSGWWFCCAVTT